jgi:predicted dehydrogenase
VQRNFEAVLDMMADGRLDVRPLISHRFPVGEAEQAYDLMVGPNPSLGILFQYPSAHEKADQELRGSTLQLAEPATRTAGNPSVGFIGSGNYAMATLIPAFKRAGARLKTVASAGGTSSMHAGRKFGFEQATTDASSVIADSQIDCVVIATRHDSHARLACEALSAGKHVFVEKPLALTEAELAEIERTRAQAVAAGRNLVLMVGFNRRYAPHVRRAKSLLAGIREPKAMVMTVNAGALPPEHWAQARDVGGGRIIGEACHFIDLLRFLAGSPIDAVQAASLGAGNGLRTAEDKATITLTFADGSLGTILYLANGHKSFPKERLEIFAAGRILQLDNFRSLVGYGWPGFGKMKLWRQDKGQDACAEAFIHGVTAGTHPIPFEEVMEVSRVTIQAAELLRS